MLRIALVDDNPKDRLALQSCLAEYAKQHEVELDVQPYPNGLAFLEAFKGGFDIVMMDVEMPHMNGIEVARRLRRADPLVVLIFVTNMVQCAVYGYEVDAVDYLLKPIHKSTFMGKMDRAVRHIAAKSDPSLILTVDSGIIRLKLSDIYYLEKDKNYLVYHTVQGEYRERGSLSEATERLADKGFSRCTAGCLVNLHHVTRISKEDVWVDQTVLPLARPQRKSFSADFLALLGGA